MAEERITDAEYEMLLGKRRDSTAQRPAAKGAQDKPSQGARSASDSAALPDVAPRLAKPLNEIHQRFSQLFAAELTRLLRRSVQLRLIQVQAVAEYPPSKKAPGAEFLAHFVARSHPERWLVEFESGILFPIIDCLLGGAGQPSEMAARPLTEVESRLTMRVIRCLLEKLSTAWQDSAIVTFDMAPPRVEIPSSPRPAILLLRFELEFGNASGTMHLGLPLPAVVRFLGRQAPVCPGPPDDLLASSEQLPEDLVQLVACLTDSRLSPEELAALAPGDIITTEHQVDQPIAVSQDGELKFQARLGAWHGHKAIEIESVLPESRDDEGESEAPTE